MNKKHDSMTYKNIQYYVRQGIALSLLFIHFHVFAQKITVAKDGTGNFTTIQAALNALPRNATKKRTVFIKNGKYVGKIFLDSIHNLIIRGESEKGVIITASQARDIWRCDKTHLDDWGAATINLRGSADIQLEKLTFINSYGFEAAKDTIVTCPSDTSGKKMVRKDGHQFALRAFPGTTRMAVRNCTFRAWGGDTVSPWDVENGQYYFKNCTMEGGVDFYCPRGSALAENCRFICHNMNAAIWHDGTGNTESKTVLKNCIFEGDNGFKLGRFHREAQFFLINCQFPANMADADIYWVTTAPKPIVWGKRVNYYNCHRKGGDFAWHIDNISKNTAEALTIQHIFKGKWKP